MTEETRTPEWTPQEEDFTVLAQEEYVSKRRKEAEHEYRDLTMAQVKHLRKRAKTDLFFLSYGILGYDLVSPKLHGHLASWLEQTRNKQYRILLLPRGHYKSTIKTISESVQMALPNDAGLDDWPYCLGPDIKMLIAHETRESASRFLFEIAEAFLSKPLMLALFPECVPSRKRQRINKWELELPRSTHPKEPTFDTIGAGGAAQGRHYHHLSLDDIIGEAARDSQVVMKTILTWFDNVNSLLTRVKFDGWDLIGTRWGPHDVYSHAIDVYGVDKERSVLRCMQGESIPDGVAATYARGVLERGNLIFPEEFSMEFIERMRKNPRVYAAQYANNPKDSSLTEFDPEWLKFYNTAGHNIIIFDGEHSEKISIWDLDRVILCDPSMGETNESDESGIIVAGMDKKKRIFLLEVIKDRLKPPQIIDIWFKLFAKWRPRLISIEDVAFSGLFAYWFRDKCDQMKIYPQIHRFKPVKGSGGRSKFSKRARIRGLGPYFASGQVFIQQGMHRFRDEYEWYGITDSEHLLDALAQGPEVWLPGDHESTRQEQENIEAEEYVMGLRDATTGY